MSSQAHWDHIYETKSQEETSWYAPHLQLSLDWIEEAAPDRPSEIIDVGGGRSTLVDDLLGHQYRAITVLDISNAALERSQKRLDQRTKDIRWLVGDVTAIELPASHYDVWHDRAVFHFLTEAPRRKSYVDQVSASLKPGGHLIIATFGPEGPLRCSGLPTMRYDAAALQAEFGPCFRLGKSSLVEHETPFGTRQQFLYCDFVFG
jgi:ubiquinone/menaquinone biosynthesis C-methylase UbiE